MLETKAGPEFLRGRDEASRARVNNAARVNKKLSAVFIMLTPLQCWRRISAVFFADGVPQILHGLSRDLRVNVVHQVEAVEQV